MNLRIDNVTYVNFFNKPKPKIKSNKTETELKVERLQSSIARINKLCEELRLGILPSDANKGE